MVYVMCGDVVGMVGLVAMGIGGCDWLIGWRARELCL